MDWYAWHAGYDGALSARLALVQAQILAALAEAPSGPVRVISMCAGQGHDVVGALEQSPRRDDVQALLVELDPRNVAAARERITAAGLRAVSVLEADAGLTDAYVRSPPADVVLACGVFGSLTDGDIDRTVAVLPTLLAPDAQLVWTAHRAAPGLWEAVIRSLDRHGFRERWTSDPSERFGVGRHQAAVAGRPFRSGVRMFSFADEETLVRTGRTAT